MSILKYKYKVHKFINYVFYVIVFLVGFLIGFSTEKINFNKLISQVLMIDNVSAAIIDNYNTFDEEFIYNSFTLNSEFDINEYPYIGCKYYKLDSYPTLYCFALNKDDFEKATYTTGSTGGLRNVTINGLNGYYYFNYRISNSSYVDKSAYTTNKYLTGVYTQEGNNHSWIRTNFDFPGITSTSYMAKNVLDFSKYFVNLEFNENLFKDNSNFKEVCIEKGKKYGITTTNIDPISNTAFVSDFIWFPGKTTGVKYSEYDSLNDNNILIFNDDVSTENYYFEDKDKIDSFYNDEIISNYFNHSGYTDKYSYYGYTAYKFMHSYYVDENDNQQNMFTIFDFTDINFSPFGSSGGSSSSFGDTPLTYCFYIKNEFSVTELKTDEWNDYTGVVPTPGGDLEVNTSHNKNNANTEDFLSQPKNFIISMKDTINLISSLIYDFYMSLPVLLRTFIITALIILIIMLIMKIGGYK